MLHPIATRQPTGARAQAGVRFALPKVNLSGPPQRGSNIHSFFFFFSPTDNTYKFPFSSWHPSIQQGTFLPSAGVETTYILLHFCAKVPRSQLFQLTYCFFASILALACFGLWADGQHSGQSYDRLHAGRPGGQILACFLFLPYFCRFPFLSMRHVRTPHCEPCAWGGASLHGLLSTLQVSRSGSAVWPLPSSSTAFMSFLD